MGIKFEIDGKNYELRPLTSKDAIEASKVYNKAYSAGLKDKDLVTRKEMLNVLKERGIWNDEEEAKLATLQKELEDLEKILDEGGIELEQAKEHAKRMLEIRNTMASANFVLGNYMTLTIEYHADKAKTDYILASSLWCGPHKYCKSLDDFYIKESQNDPVLDRALMEWSGGLDKLKEAYDSFTEVKFLKEFGFMNEDFVLLDENQPLIPEEEKPKEKKPFLRDGKPITKE